MICRTAGLAEMVGLSNYLAGFLWAPETCLLGGLRAPFGHPVVPLSQRQRQQQDFAGDENDNHGDNDDGGNNGHCAEGYLGRV